MSLHNPYTYFSIPLGPRIAAKIQSPLSQALIELNQNLKLRGISLDQEQSPGGLHPLGEEHSTLQELSFIKSQGRNHRRRWVKLLSVSNAMLAFYKAGRRRANRKANEGSETKPIEFVNMDMGQLKPRRGRPLLEPERQLIAPKRKLRHVCNDCRERKIMVGTKDQ